ncbi:hypothetical protein B4140_0812 [Bacillus amyloliquefaciens]|nr:hypothetical protein B4140_0812 [Bacillus amyloliquefaciens]
MAKENKAMYTFVDIFHIPLLSIYDVFHQSIVDIRELH